MSKKTLVIGASTKPDRYAYKAAKQLLAHGHTIELLGNRTGNIDNHEIFTVPQSIENIDTIQGEIKGRFNLTFVPDTLLQTKFKDTVYFKNSTFTAKLVK